MRLKTLFLPLLGLLAMSCDRQKEDVLDYVNPNLGTVHSRWFVYTPASEPFGLAKLGASTNGTYGNKDGWEAVGYEDGHTSIDGFPLSARIPGRWCCIDAHYRGGKDKAWSA